MTKDNTAKLASFEAPVAEPQYAPLLQTRRITKRFGPTIALHDIDFDLAEGEVHALVGENGAGKSTLIKILSGVYRLDSGEIYIKGQPTTFTNPRDAQRAGIATIFQETSLYNDLTVLENLFVGKIEGARFRVPWKKWRREAQEIFRRLSLDIPLDFPAGALSVGQAEMVEIARAVCQNAHLIIMDEPSASLSEREVERLFATIRDLVNHGVAVLYVSHRLEEIFRIADRVTVLRDGGRILSTRISDLTRDDVIRAMIGRDVSAYYARQNDRVPPGEVLLEVKGVTSASAGVHDVNFSVRRGEIVGLAGLVGAGRSEIAQAIAGFYCYERGRVLVNGRTIPVGKPDTMLDYGLAYLPEDRRAQGLFLELGLNFNVTLPILRDLVNFFHGEFGLIDEAREEDIASEAIRKLNIQTPGTKATVKRLSGGNQQKVLFGKWLSAAPDVLLLDEPTRGIDVGTKAEMHRLIRQLSREGKAIVLISSELPELLWLSDRILVVRGGTIVGELIGEEASQENVLRLALGV